MAHVHLGVQVCVCVCGCGFVCVCGCVWLIMLFMIHMLGSRAFDSFVVFFLWDVESSAQLDWNSASQIPSIVYRDLRGVNYWPPIDPSIQLFPFPHEIVSVSCLSPSLGLSGNALLKQKGWTGTDQSTNESGLLSNKTFILVLICLTVCEIHALRQKVLLAQICII